MAFKNNHFKKTSILIGTNLNEGSYFLPYWKEEYFPLVDKTFLTRELVGHTKLRSPNACSIAIRFNV
jgi:hypothetical protein